MQPKRTTEGKEQYRAQARCVKVAKSTDEGRLLQTASGKKTEYSPRHKSIILNLGRTAATEQTGRNTLNGMTFLHGWKDRASVYCSWRSGRLVTEKMEPSHTLEAHCSFRLTTSSSVNETLGLSRALPSTSRSG